MNRREACCSESNRHNVAEVLWSVSINNPLLLCSSYTVSEHETKQAKIQIIPRSSASFPSDWTNSWHHITDVHPQHSLTDVSSTIMLLLLLHQALWIPNYVTWPRWFSPPCPKASPRLRHMNREETAGPLLLLSLAHNARGAPSDESKKTNPRERERQGQQKIMTTIRERSEFC